MIPVWLHWLAILSLAAALLCSLAVIMLERHMPPHMKIMNVVWPLTALYAGPLGLWFYLRHGRMSHHAHGETPFPAAVAKATTHCGSGCTLGDLCAETLAFLFPGIAVAFGWQSLFAEKIFAVWVLDYLLAFAFGILFQYCTIVPMKKLSPGRGLLQAIKADTLSLTAWQVGMYGFMAVAQFWLFRTVFGVLLQADQPEFWFMMRIAMLCGFGTSFPVNWWLVRTGIKEKM